jgi:hypothetical protein
MGLSAQQWWLEWQLRVLVLGSLFVQFILFFSAALRKRVIPSWIRFIIWLSYVGGDALAIYALATLFDRNINKHQTSDGGTSTLELIWAPILLIHLGGQPNITAYSLEDNMQWKQQATVVISKVTITLYVFIKWWSGEKKLWKASFLLFFFGIAKFAQKPLALWSASYDTIVDFMAKNRPIAETNKISFEEYVQKAEKSVQDKVVSNNQAELYGSNFPLTLYADLPVSYSGRLRNLSSFLKLDEKHAYSLLQKCQGDTFMILYSKVKGIRFYRRFISMHLLLIIPVFAFLGIFAKVHKDGYKKNDVTVTYILLFCTAVLEILSLFLAPALLSLTTWHVMVSQYSLVSFRALKESTILMKIAIFNVVQMYLYENWYAEDINAAFKITNLVRLHIEQGWNSYIRDTASYRVFNNCRGQLTLHNRLRGHHQRQRLDWSLRLPFDESVLLWHIATELCFQRSNRSPQGRQAEAVQVMQSSMEISNYMIYLFCAHPEMLLSGTRISLLPVASNAIELVIKEIPVQLNTEDIIAQDRTGSDTTNVDVNLSINDSPAAADTGVGTNGTLVRDARRLTSELMDLVAEHGWELVQGVWVEMLCYSAARSKGYLHAKSLGDGGECLSYVWLLWSFMGMEILSDKIQMPEPPGEAEIAATGKPEEGQRT